MGSEMCIRDSTFTIPALAGADTEAGKAEAAIEEALTAAETAVTEGMEER